MSKQDKEIKKIEDVKDEAIAELMAMDGVTGVDIGYRYKAGVRTDEICLRVHVEKKKDKLTKGQKIPAKIKGISTDIIESKIDLQALTTVMNAELSVVDNQAYDVMQGGITISTDSPDGQSAETGTLGLVVMDNVTKKPVILTNGHVVGGDVGTIGKPVYQLFSWTLGNSPVGHVLRARQREGIDAAVISIENKNYSFDVVDLGGIKGTSGNVTLGMTVRKRGRTTRLTEGIVEGVKGTYGSPTGGPAYQDIITIAPVGITDFSIHGDSGSVVVNTNNEVVALLYAGFESTLVGGALSGRTVAIPIQNVMKAMNIQLIASENTPDVPIAKIKYPTVKIGVRGPAVKTMQEMLNKLGYRLDLDGIFGKFTQGVVKQFQRDHLLDADGIVGPMSWDIIQKSVNALPKA
jgi:Putative peptidoglycan binding domain/Trypsin-like peptidase domain